jgi:phosphatidylserine decarboxylase
MIPLFLAMIPLALSYWLVALPLLALAAFMAYFFRDPERAAPTEDGIIVSPADGRVTRVQSLSPDDPLSPQLVSIFLSPLDVHVNRAPIAGRITNVTYAKGKFLMATREEASLVNEQNTLTIEGGQVTVVCKQVAGVLARRIVCWKQAGDRVHLGERFGLIKFSSRTDLVLPPEVEVVVREGMRVRGGTTVIGRMP